MTLDRILFHDWYVFGHDIENRTEDDPTRDGLLLSAFCLNDEEGQEEVITIDNTSVDNTEVFNKTLLNRCMFISHNADHEAKYGVATGFLPMRYICTMVNRKRMLAGQEGFRFDLVSEINRALGYKHIPIWMDKDIRNTFNTCLFFDDEQILYNAADTIKLKKVYYQQRKEADEAGQTFMLNINSRCIIPIAQAEVKGVKHNSEKWLQITADRKEKADKVCQELDEIITLVYGVNPETVNPVLKKEREKQERKLQKLVERKEKLEQQLLKLEELQKTHLKSYLTQQTSLKNLISELQKSDLKSPLDKAKLINWGSPKQVISVLAAISCPLPEAKDQKTRKLKPGVKKEARINWFVANEDSPFVPLMKKFDEFQKLKHNISSFGEEWVKQYVRNGRAYTSLDQAGTTTGRFSSGSKGGKKGKKRYANIQQIPVREGKEYRECFIADPGRMLITADYRNCEGVVMIAQSGDLNMKKITEMKDSHSYLGTKAWRAAYAVKYNRTKDPRYLELSQSYEMNKSTPEKEKERDTFKNSGGLFPCAYGVTANKVAATSKITEAEAQAMIDAVKAEVPLVIKALDEKSKEASQKGYVKHNARTGSRRYFTAILDNLKYGFPVTNSEITDAELEARNSPIQGTNSDIMKEAIAWIALWNSIFKQDVWMLFTVHDEDFIDCPKEAAEEVAKKVEKLMTRAAKQYLIPEIDMEVDVRVADHWKK